jgi:arsenite-transporting ATPase
MNDEQEIGKRSSFIVHLSSLATRRILLFGGKGGVGKTTISIAAALHFSRSRKTILFTTDPASNLEDFLGTRHPAPGTLSIESLHAEDLYRKFLDQNLDKFLELGDRGTYLDKDELRRFFELSLPGIDELMAWMRIGELAEENEGAMIVVDTAPTGHTLRMLASSEHFRQFAAALDAMEQKHRDMVQQLTRQRVRDAIDDFIADFEARARRRREMFTDAKTTGFVPVLLSEEWVVVQTKRLIDEVRADGIDVPLAVLNRTAPECDCARCREQAKRDQSAETSLGASVTVVRARRACVPLDSPERIAQWSA